MLTLTFVSFKTIQQSSKIPSDVNTILSLGAMIQTKVRFVIHTLNCYNLSIELPAKRFGTVNILSLEFRADIG